MKNLGQAFKWIVHILQKHSAPFQISGGLAAKVYGAERELVDIDISIPEEDFDKILNDVKEYIVFGPKRFVDENWDIFMMTLRYQGQDIDICAAEAKIRNAKTGEWETDNIDFTKSEMKDIWGLSVPVISKEYLVSYKKKLARDVDIEDINAISK